MWLSLNSIQGNLKHRRYPRNKWWNTIDTVLNVHKILKLDPPVELNAMDNYHRVVRSPFAGRPKAIIVKLSSYRAHRHLYDARNNLSDHNEWVRRLADTNDVFREAGTDYREVPVPTEPPQQHAGRHPGYCATTCNPCCLWSRPWFPPQP